MFKGINRHEMSILASKGHIINIKLLLCFHSSRTENGICKAPQKVLINFTSWSVNNWNYSAFKLLGENKSQGEIRFDPNVSDLLQHQRLSICFQPNLLPSKAKMQPGSVLMPVRRSCCQRTLSISCEWGGNYPWSVNTIHPQHLTCIWDRHSHAGPLLTIGPPCPQQMNSYIHLHKFHGSWLNPFMDQIVPPATTRCYCSTNLFNFFFFKLTLLTANSEIYESKILGASSQSSIILEKKKEFVFVSPLHKHLECRFLLPGLNIHPHVCHATAAPTTGQRKTMWNKPNAGKNAKGSVGKNAIFFFFWCSDAQQTEAWVPIWHAFEY